MKDFQILESESLISSCGKYRWWLKKSLSVNRQRTLLFIGLNPSTATSNEDDMTLRRLLKFCHSWGYRDLLVINLFARRSKSPRLLKHCFDPIGKKNNDILAKFISVWSRNIDWDLWLGWGAGGALFKRNNYVLRLIEPSFIMRMSLFPKAIGPLALGVTRGGHPLHPLYVPALRTLSSFCT